MHDSSIVYSTCSNILVVKVKKIDNKCAANFLAVVLRKSVFNIIQEIHNLLLTKINYQEDSLIFIWPMHVSRVILWIFRQITIWCK